MKRAMKWLNGDCCTLSPGSQTILVTICLCGVPQRMGLCAHERRIRTFHCSVSNKRAYKGGFVSDKDLKAMHSGSVPTVFRQNGSQPWSSHAYGRANGKQATLSSGGCGVLALTNSIYHATNGTFVDPAFIADFSVANGDRVNDAGTKDKLASDFLRVYGSKIGCKFVRDERKLSAVKGDLQKGAAVICHVNGHFVTLAGFKNSKFLVIDSYPSKNRGTASGYAWMTESQFKGRMALTTGTSTPLHVIKKCDPLLLIKTTWVPHLRRPSQPIVSK